MRLALFEPDIPQNVGSIIRLGACMGVPVDVIEPCGFPFTDKGLKRAGMDYMTLAEIQRHICWEDFLGAQRAASRRIVLLTTRAETTMNHFKFKRHDVLMVGRESSGVTDAVYEAVDARVRIPMVEGVRSLNVAMSAAIALGEAMHQCGSYPENAVGETRHERS